jgi:surface antigen
MSDTPETMIPANEILVMLCADLEADGRLSPDQRAALKAVLARHSELQELYESFRFTRNSLASPFDAALAAPIPERLLRTVCKSGTLGARPLAARRSWARSWVSRAWHGEVWRAPWFSPAIGIAVLFMSLAAGWLLHTATGDGTSANARAAIASARVQHALELTPSGVKADVGGNVRIEPRLTFATEDKVWCRQYSLSYGDSLEAGGVACRNGEGEWRLVIETGLAAQPPPPPANSPVLAGSSPLSDHERMLDSIRSQLKRGDVLGREEEAERIAQHWKRKS